MNYDSWFLELQRLLWLSRVGGNNNNNKNNNNNNNNGRRSSRRLRDAPEWLRNDKDFVLRIVQRDGTALAYVSQNLRDNKEVVSAAVQQSGGALYYASTNLQNDKDVVLKAVQQFAFALEYASKTLQDDEEVVFRAVQSHGWALRFASDRLLNGNKNKAFVEKVIQEDWRSIQYVPVDLLKRNREIILRAVQIDGHALQFVPTEYQNDKEIVLQAVRQYGLALEHASQELQNDKEIVLAAIASKPDAIKFVSNQLKLTDKETWKQCLVAARVLDHHHHHNPFHRPCDDYESTSSPTPSSASPFVDTETTTRTSVPRKIVMSTRYSIKPDSGYEATNFTAMLKKNEFVQTGNFVVYSPNAFDKSTCDPNWTDNHHPCRGTFETCGLPDIFKRGPPQDSSCWRYSYRYHLQQATESQGFMIQIVESEDSWREPQVLGKGQCIEREMAKALGTKIFRVHRPRQRAGLTTKDYLWFWNPMELDKRFEESDVEKVVDRIKEWYKGGCKNMSECTMHFPRRI